MVSVTGWIQVVCVHVKCAPLISVPLSETQKGGKITLIRLSQCDNYRMHTRSTN